MRLVSRVRTDDGSEFPTLRDARKHLENLYGTKLLNIGKKLTLASYSEVTAYIDANVREFVLLAELRREIETGLPARDDNEGEE